MLVFCPFTLALQYEHVNVTLLSVLDTVFSKLELKIEIQKRPETPVPRQFLLLLLLFKCKTSLSPH